MLVLPIKKKWFDMIKSGEKKEEYREIKPYYKIRFYNAIKKVLDKETFAQQVTAVILYDNSVMLDVSFRNGYNKNSPKIKCKCIFKGKGQGKEEWGAEKRKRILYFRNTGGIMLSKEEIRKHYIFTTEHELDEDNKKLKQYIEQLEHEIHLMNKVIDIQIVGVNEGAKLFAEKQKLIEKLEKDVINITKTLQDGKHSDDYSRCRLKAYRTKTKEILEIVKGEKNESERSK